MVSKAGQTIRINLHDVRVMGRNTQGVKLANLKEDTIIAIQKVTVEEAIVDETPSLDGENAQVDAPAP